MAPDAAPPGVTGFNDPVVGPDGYTLPATQHDVVIWLTGASYDVVFDLSRGVVAALAGHAVLAHEIVGWPYHHDLDLTGFIDGTENPTLVEATDGRPGRRRARRARAVRSCCSSSGSTTCRPGKGCRCDGRRRSIGRRKVDSTELDPKPPTSHVARTDQDAFGKIFRRNIAYGSLAEPRDDLRGLLRQPADPGRRCSTAWSAATDRATS